MALWRYGKYALDGTYSNYQLVDSPTGMPYTNPLQGDPPSGLYMLPLGTWSWNAEEGFVITGYSQLYTQIEDIGFGNIGPTITNKFQITDIDETLVYFDIYIYETCDVEYSQGDYIEEVEAEYGTYPDNGMQDGFWWVALGAVAPALSVKVGGAWKPVAGVYVRIAGAWKTVAGIYTRIGGAWKST